MIDIEKIKAELPNMPLVAREELAKVLNQSISNDHEKLAANEEAEHLAICKKRLARFDAGETRAVPFEEAISRVFGQQ